MEVETIVFYRNLTKQAVLLWFVKYYVYVIVSKNVYIALYCQIKASYHFRGIQNNDDRGLLRFALTSVNILNR